MDKIIIRSTLELRHLILNNYENIEKYDYSSITDISYMFSNEFIVDSIPWFDTSNVTNFQSLFENCESLIEVPLLDTSKATNMSHLFFNCESLIEVPWFDTSNVINMEMCFSGCKLLKKLPLLEINKSASLDFFFDDFRKFNLSNWENNLFEIKDICRYKKYDNYSKEELLEYISLFREVDPFTNKSLKKLEKNDILQFLRKKF